MSPNDDYVILSGSTTNGAVRRDTSEESLRRNENLS
jgi:hypothetical protein